MSNPESLDGTGDSARLSLSRHEAQLLEIQLSRDVARLEQELQQRHEADSAFAYRIEELRRIDSRLRALIQEFEPLPDIV